MKKRILVIGIIALLIIVISLFFVVRRNGRPEINNEAPKISELSFDKLDTSANPGVGFVMAYESDSFIIFYGNFGLFGYDLSAKEMVFDVDFAKAYGKKGQIQGLYGTYVEVDISGKNIVLTYTDPDAPDDILEAYYFDVPSLTYHRGDYQPMEDIFQHENAMGYVIPGGSIENSKYVRGDEEWAIFEKYA